jgi:flagellar hook protein FlgE
MGFAQGVSGLNASAANLDVIGNNIANSGTVGFKSGSVLFSDVYAGSRVGLGTQVAGVSQNFTSGAVQTSSRGLDVAIVNGDGFFRLASPGGEIAYSRNGQFDKDKDGYIVNAAGMRLTGYGVAANGSIAGGSPSALQLPTSAMAPNATQNISAQFNIDSRSTVPVKSPFDPGDSATYNYANAVTVYDSLGNSHEVSTFFVKTASNTWDVYATADGAPIKGSAVAIAAATTAATTATTAATTAAATAAASAAIVAAAGAAATPAEIAQAATDAAAETAANAAAASATANIAAVTNGGKNGQLTFDSSGKLLTPTDGKMAMTGITFANGSAPMSFTADVTGTTQFGNVNDVKKLTQDGYTSGTLVAFAINEDGTITGKYSNEQAKTLGQVVLSSFVNPNGLKPTGGNLWSETASSGQPLTGTPGAGTKMGALASGALEASNVDLTSELVNLIIAQRTYQANAQTVKTQDQVMQTLVNMR